MEKLTIARLGQEKTINYQNKKTNRPDSFNKIGFQSNEKPEVWIDFTYRGACPLVIGNQYDLDVTPREYNGKTYYDAKLPRVEKGSGISEEQYKTLMREITAVNQNVLRVLAIVDTKLSSGDEPPTF